MIRAALVAAVVSIVLPGEFAPFPDIKGGPSAEAVNSNCLACHSAEMVTNQPRLSEAEWHGIVGKMRAAYKAPIAESDDAAIVAWLTAMQRERASAPIGPQRERSGG